VAGGAYKKVTETLPDCVESRAETIPKFGEMVENFGNLNRWLPKLTPLWLWGELDKAVWLFI
jgi:hypothetical protein